VRFEKIAKLRESKFIRMNAIFFVGSLAVAFLNYLYYPVLARMLAAEQFGEVQVLVSFFLQATIFLNVLSLVIVNIMGEESEQKEKDLSIRELEKLALLIGAILFVITLFISPFLASQLKFTSSLGFIAIAAVFLISIPLAFRTAFLRGKGDFGSVSVSGVISAFTKIIFSAALVYIGWHTFGAIFGIFFAQALAYGYAIYRSNQANFPSRSKTLKIDWVTIRPRIKYSSFVLFVSLVVTALFSIDVAVVKYFFSPEAAGAYAGISTVARIIYFLTASIAVVLLSSVRPTLSNRANTQSLRKSLLLTLVIGGAATVGFCLFPTFFVHLLMGSKYDAYAHLLPMLSVVVLLVSIANVIANYFMALRDYTVSYVMGVAVITTFFLISLRNNSIEEIVQDMLLSSMLLVIILLLKRGVLRTNSV
jgi:O-antigen/teichoic acid export membrane protein